METHGHYPILVMASPKIVVGECGACSGVGEPVLLFGHCVSFRKGVKVGQVFEFGTMGV